MGFRGQWQPQFVQYNAGDVVEYQGSLLRLADPV